MISPEYLEQCPDRLTEIYEQAERDIIADMARKLNKYDYFSSASEWQAKKLQEMGLTYKEIQTRLAKASGKSKSEIVKLLKEAGTKELSDDGVEPTQATIDVLNAGLDKTLGTFDNLTKTTAIYGSRQISEALDRVYMQVTSGAFSQEAAIKNAITELAKKGIEAYDYGTRKDYIDVVVRRAVRTGVNQTVAKISLSNADQLGTDLVEVSAHSGARPTHAEWQGKVFSISGKTKGYEKLSEATGYGTVTGLCGANCRHTFYPFMEGDEPAYTEEELQSYDEPKYTHNGHKMTEYVATQRQRYIERQIRRYKREKAGMQAAELPTEESQAKIKKWEEIQADFLSQTGLKRQVARENVPNVVNGKTPSAPSTPAPGTKKKASKQADNKQAKLDEQAIAKENEALEWFASGEGQWINQYKRGRGDFGKISEQEEEMIAAIERATSRDDVAESKLYRSVDAEAIFGEMSQSEYEDLYKSLRYGAETPREKMTLEKALSYKGKTITEKGFMSTTKKYDIAAEWYDYTGSTKSTVIEFDVPKGVKGKDMKQFEVEGEEQYEVLLKNNTPYTIKEIGAKDGNIFIKAEIKVDKLLEKRKKNDIMLAKAAGAEEYVGKEIISTDNQHIREWYVANVNDIPNQVDANAPIKKRAKQAYDLRNKYKKMAREAMSDKDTSECLKLNYPPKSFDELVERKMKSKGLSREEALEDVFKTASTTNKKVNKRFGIEGEKDV